MVIGYDQVKPERTGDLRLAHGADAAVNGNDESCSGRLDPFQSLRVEAVGRPPPDRRPASRTPADVLQCPGEVQSAGFGGLLGFEGGAESRLPVHADGVRPVFMNRAS